MLPHPTRNTYTLLLIVTFVHLYSMPGPRIEPRTTTYRADVITGRRDKHYTTSLPTTIMMNKTHADIYQMVSKPMGICHVYATRHFKQSMCGVDRVYQNVGKCILCRIGSKNCWWPLLLYFLDIYIMCNRRQICIVPCHRERIVPKTCQPLGERSPKYCTRRLPQSRQWETEETKM